MDAIVCESHTMAFKQNLKKITEVLEVPNCLDLNSISELLGPSNLRHIPCTLLITVI